MMKYKPVPLIIVCLILLCVTGCSDAEETSDVEEASDVMVVSDAEEASDAEEESGVEVARDIDIDLSELSRIMVQAEFQNIHTNWEENMGKTIRVNGLYYSLFWEQTGLHYHYVMVAEGDGCCPRTGFEFKLVGDTVSTDDYPAQDTMIEVTGIISRYEELGVTYLYLAVDEIVILSS